MPDAPFFSTRSFINHGHLTTPRNATWRAVLLSGGALSWLILFIFLVLPGLLVSVLAFASRGDYGQLVWSFTIGKAGDDAVLQRVHRPGDHQGL